MVSLVFLLALGCSLRPAGAVAGPVVTIPTAFVANTDSPALDVGTGWEKFPAIGSVLRVGTIYYMYYASGGWGGGQIGLAEAASPNGPWTRYRGNPILGPGPAGSWDDYATDQPRVYEIGGRYYMLYGANQNKWRGGHWTWRIGLAEAASPEGPWTKFSGNPVLDAGELGQWDGLGISLGSMLKVGNEYWMWYAGWQDEPDAYGQIGLAVSKSPQGPWVKHAGNPVFAPRAWSVFGSQEPVVLFSGGLFHMWYGGLPVKGDSNYADIGYATSVDGTTWSDFGGNPVLHRGAGDYNVSEPYVLTDSGRVYLYYTRFAYPSMDYDIRLASGE